MDKTESKENINESTAEDTEINTQSTQNDDEDQKNRRSFGYYKRRYAFNI